MARFINIKNCKMGGTPVTTIKSIGYNRSANVIADSGDNDRYQSWAAKGLTTISIQISLADPVQAAALENAAAGTFEFNGEPEEGGQERHVEITNAIFSGRSVNASHNALWNGSISGIATAPDGQTDPITETLV